MGLSSHLHLWMFRMLFIQLIYPLRPELLLNCGSWLQVHHGMCTKLRKFVERITKVFPEIEAARPGCSSGVQALCSLNDAIEKAKSLLQYCSESSKLYLVRICFWFVVKNGWEVRTVSFKCHRSNNCHSSRRRKERKKNEIISQLVLSNIKQIFSEIN